ncbi:hypothetical protein BJ166DRAFT_497396 [Pestalotiopsis sp. NC0098]|nr:hypothetical protein BJ166DRAFT_497396 [Pestalotiopsis sp. NC0098]
MAHRQGLARVARLAADAPPTESPLGPRRRAGLAHHHRPDPRHRVRGAVLRQVLRGKDDRSGQNHATSTWAVGLDDQDGLSDIVWKREEKDGDDGFERFAATYFPMDHQTTSCLEEYGCAKLYQPQVLLGGVSRLQPLRGIASRHGLVGSSSQQDHRPAALHGHSPQDWRGPRSSGQMHANSPAGLFGSCWCGALLAWGMMNCKDKV